jgi:hypothetical protein
MVGKGRLMGNELLSEEEIWYRYWPHRCYKCRGTGLVYKGLAYIGDDWEKCPDCDGTGKRENEMKLSEMSKDERSNLLYIECCAVDQGGLVDARKINDEDLEILRSWDAKGFITFSRISFDSLQLLVDKNKSYLVTLSEGAWKLAHEERRARSKRMASKSPYCNLVTTKKLRGPSE